MLVQFLALYTDHGRLRKHRHIETTLSRSSKVIDFGTNRKHVCDFLLVRHSNLGPILLRFGDMTAFMCSTPPLFTLNLGVFPLHYIAHVGVTKRTGLKLFGRDIIFEIFQPVWKSYLNVKDRQTDRQRDGQTTYCCITALCVVLRGKNYNSNDNHSSIWFKLKVILRIHGNGSGMASNS